MINIFGGVLVISKSCYSKEWITDIKKVFPKKNPELIEKVIMALTLLEKLKLSGLEFTFKGGTSLLLLIDGAHRFSIDIDIIISKKPENFDEVLDFIISDGIFLRHEEQKRKAGRDIPKAHYKFIYKSALNGSEAPILLDILLEENPYIQTKMVPIKSVFINVEDDSTEVFVPSINCILGDKLTAYAPNTTGIAYGAGKDLEIIKQLYDVSKLFDLFDNINIVRETFEKIAKQELAYRGLEHLSTDDVLDDIFKTSCTIAYGGINIVKDDEFRELKSGISKLGDFVYSENYMYVSGVLSAAKAAYLAMLLKSGSSGIGDRFDPKLDLKNTKVSLKEFSDFNRLKKISAEAFYYWYRTIDLVKEISNTKNLKETQSE
jgi:predicted nucleotidyltransferase component of viral defense system